MVTTRPIEKGELIDRDNVWVKRPGTGPIKAVHYPEVLGKRAKRSLPNDRQLAWSDFE